MKVAYPRSEKTVNRPFYMKKSHFSRNLHSFFGFFWIYDRHTSLTLAENTECCSVQLRIGQLVLFCLSPFVCIFLLIAIPCVPWLLYFSRHYKRPYSWFFNRRGRRERGVFKVITDHSFSSHFSAHLCDLCGLDAAFRRFHISLRHYIGAPLKNTHSVSGLIFTSAAALPKCSRSPATLRFCRLASGKNHLKALKSDRPPCCQWYSPCTG